MTLPPLITKYLKKLSPKKGSAHTHPSRDWLILLTITLLLLIASIGWNVWFFASVLTGEEMSLSPEGDAAIEQSSLQRAQAAFETRSLEQGKYRGEYRFVDPSR